MLTRSILIALVAASLLAGCVKPAADAVDPAATGSADGMLAPKTEKLDATIQYSAATPMRATGGTVPTTIKPSANITGYVIEVEWTPSAPMNDELALWVRATGAGDITNPANFPMPPQPIAKVIGQSPLRLAIAAADFPDDAEYDVLIRASEPGVAVNQDLIVHVTTFKDVPFDAEFTAIGATESEA